MEKELKIKTSRKAAGCKMEEEEEGVYPVSPSGYYFNSSELSLTILAVLESEVPIDDSQALALLHDVFLPINPRFSSIMVTGRNNKKLWKKVEVILEDHIQVPMFSSGLPVQSYDKHFDEYLTKIAMELLPQDRPLWEIHIYKYPTSKGAGHIIFKLHHALGDGYSLMGALLSCLQRADDSSRPLSFPVYRMKRNQTVGLYRRIMTCVPRAISISYNTLYDYTSSILRSIVFEDDRTPIRSGNKDVEYKPMSITTLEFSLEKIKHIKYELGMTINDVVTSIVFYGLRHYMQGKSERWASSNSTLFMLMNTRSINGYKSISEMMRPDNNTTKTLWGNQFAFLHVSIPKLSQNDELHDPLKFVLESKRIIQTKKNSLAYKFTAHTLEIMRKCVGPKVVSRFIRKTMRNASVSMSNMIGPLEKMTLSNQPIKGLYFIVCGSPQSAEITVLSYMQTLRICIGVEKSFIDVQEFKSCIEKAFEKIFDAATKKER